MHSAVASSTDRYSQTLPSRHGSLPACLQLGTQPQPSSVFTQGTSPAHEFRSGNSFSTHVGAHPPWTHSNFRVHETAGSPALFGSQEAPADRVPGDTQLRHGSPREVRATTRHNMPCGHSSSF